MPRTRLRRSKFGLAPAALACWLAIGGSLACACTIPVFRYALERWESDRFLVMVYHQGELTAEQNLVVAELTQRSSLKGGPLNIEVIRHDLAAPSPLKLLDLQLPTADRPLPWMEIRSRISETRTALRWQGPLTEAVGKPGLFDSPARNEIVRRLLDGDSCVWLLVAPEDQVQRLSQQLQPLLDAAPKDLELPKGVGLPGSELYSPIPLNIRFSVLPLSHADPEEQPFFKLLAASTPEWRTDTAYVIPVFGRCRALEVFPFADANEALIQDVGSFLCAACSCRVKQANPGFDLLVSVDWNQRLFGDSLPQGIPPSERPSGPIISAGLAESPVLVTIPAGAQSQKTTPQEAAPSDEVQPGESDATASTVPVITTQIQQSRSPITLLMLIAILALVCGGLLAGIIYIRK